jgi:UDP-N-acetylglucosamine 1-carboxyvinyltransferase
MHQIKIMGGVPLKGEIAISGAKNAALPLMTAALLTDESLILTNMPHLADITSMEALLDQHGVHLSSDSNHKTLTLTARTIHNTTAPYDIVRKMRASILVLGPLWPDAAKHKSLCPAAAPSVCGL